MKTIETLNGQTVVRRLKSRDARGSFTGETWGFSSAADAAKQSSEFADAIPESDAPRVILDDVSPPFDEPIKQASLASRLFDFIA